VRNATPALSAQTTQRNCSFLGLKATTAFWPVIDEGTTLPLFIRALPKITLPGGSLSVIAMLHQLMKAGLGGESQLSRFKRSESPQIASLLSS
jgi:hypothetical protein